MTKQQIKDLIEQYEFEGILARFNLSPWKTLEILDELGYIYLEQYEDDN